MVQTSHHPNTEGRIPSSLLDTYVRYKRDTRAVITWLMSHGTQKLQSLKVLSIRDLVSLAALVEKKAVPMPMSIDFHFREAIAARKGPPCNHTI